MSRKTGNGVFKISNSEIFLSQDSTLENLAGQLQKNTDKLICVINGKHLRFYEKNENFPPTSFSRKHEVNDVTEYYFIDSRNSYCIFDEMMAKIFNPGYEGTNKKKKAGKLCSFNSQLGNKIEDSRKLCRKMTPTQREQDIIRKKTGEKIVTIFESNKTITLPLKESKVEITEYEI